MPKIELETKIKSTLDICFDLSLSIDLHQISTAKTKERAIARTISGLIQLHETVTWQAIHFGIQQKLTSKITAFERPYFFKDEQVKGAFKSFAHEHRFELEGEYVTMKDSFVYASPYGILGKIFNSLILTNYLRRFLIERNQVIKNYAESNPWKILLQEK